MDWLWVIEILKGVEAFEAGVRIKAWGVSPRPSDNQELEPMKWATDLRSH